MLIPYYYLAYSLSSICNDKLSYIVCLKTLVDHIILRLLELFSCALVWYICRFPITHQTLYLNSYLIYLILCVTFLHFNVYDVCTNTNNTHYLVLQCCRIVDHTLHNIKIPIVFCDVFDEFLLESSHFLFKTSHCWFTYYSAVFVIHRWNTPFLNLCYYHDVHTRYYYVYVTKSNIHQWYHLNLIYGWNLFIFLLIQIKRSCHHDKNCLYLFIINQ